MAALKQARGADASAPPERAADTSCKDGTCNCAAMAVQVDEVVKKVDDGFREQAVSISALFDRLGSKSTEGTLTHNVCVLKNDMDALTRKVDDGFARVDERFTRVDERFDALARQVGDGFARADERFARADERFTRVEERLDTLARDVGTLVAMASRIVASRD
jgi:hypothetical protein